MPKTKSIIIIAPNNDRQPKVAPTPTHAWTVVFPDRAAYVGAPKLSDRETLQAPMGEPSIAYPGSGVPGQPWESPPIPARRRIR